MLGRNLVQRAAVDLGASRETFRHKHVERAIHRRLVELRQLHQATVYRALDVLVAEGLARRTEIDGRALYEVAAEHLHHHVVCTSCGAVQHVHDETVRNALQKVARESGYALAEEELTFRGLCPACAR